MTPEVIHVAGIFAFLSSRFAGCWLLVADGDRPGQLRVRPKKPKRHFFHLQLSTA
jgi:hypothetical protein